MCSNLGVSSEKILDIPNYPTSPHFNDQERVALEYADHMTITGQNVSESLFDRLRMYFSDDELVELTATIAWENCSSKFNRALRVDSQQLWKCE